MFGRQRLAAEPTTVEAVWWGEAATVVWNGVGTGPGASVETSGTSNGDRYVLTEAGTIPSVDDDGAIVVYQIIRGVDGDEYAIEFDAVECTTVATSDDAMEIADALAVEIEAQHPTFTVTTWSDGTEDGALVLIQGKGAEEVVVGTSTTDPDNVALWAGVQLTMEAEE